MSYCHSVVLCDTVSGSDIQMQITRTLALIASGQRWDRKWKCELVGRSESRRFWAVGTTITIGGHLFAVKQKGQ
jgi:hypothetical protein